MLALFVSSIYKRLLTEIRYAKKNNGESFKNRILLNIFNDYKESTEKGNDNINRDAIIEKHIPFYVEKIEFLLNYLIAAATILGLFGTFIGLTGAIIDLKSVLVNIEKMEQFIEGIKPPLASMATAFITSITGIAASIFMNIVSVVPLVSYKNYREQFYDELEDFLDNNIYVKYNPSTTKALMIFTDKVEKSMKYMTDKVTETFDEGIKHFSSKINSVSIDLTESAKTLSSVIDKLEKSVSTFNTPVLSFKQSVDSFKLYYEGLDIKIKDTQIIADGVKVNFEKMILALGDNSEKINNIGLEFSKSTNMLAEEHRRFNNILDNMEKYTFKNDEQMKNIIKSTEEAYKLLASIIQEFKNQTENMGGQISVKLSSVLNRELGGLSADLNNAVENNYVRTESVNKSLEGNLDTFGKTLKGFGKLIEELERAEIELSGVAISKEE